MTSLSTCRMVASDSDSSSSGYFTTSICASATATAAAPSCGKEEEAMATTTYLTIVSDTDKRSTRNRSVEDSGPTSSKATRNRLESGSPVLFLGAPSSTMSGLEWISNRLVLYRKFRKLLHENGGKLGSTTVAHLSKPTPPPPGTLATAVITSLNDPGELYVVLEVKENYSLDHPDWTKSFPPFRNGVEALVGLTRLLGTYFQIMPHSPEDLSGFAVGAGDLVSVRFIQNSKNAEGKPIHVFQIRRGLITQVTVNPNLAKPPLYWAYLLDFGYHVVVSKECLLPLPKPFNCIAPLAMKACLFGVSPVGEKWDVISKDYFEEEVYRRAQSIFSVEVMSRVDPSYSSHTALLVNLETRKYIPSPEDPDSPCLRFDMNFAEELIRYKRAVPWNLFPARPKLMGGATPISVLDKRLPVRKDADASSVKSVMNQLVPHMELSFQKSLLLTPYYPAAPTPLPVQLLERELDKLFRARQKHLVDVFGMENRLMMRVAEKDPQMLKLYKTPCTICNTRSQETAQVKEVTDEEWLSWAGASRNVDKK